MYFLFSSNFSLIFFYISNNFKTISRIIIFFCWISKCKRMNFCDAIHFQNDPFAGKWKRRLILLIFIFHWYWLFGIVEMLRKFPIMLPRLRVCFLGIPTGKFLKMYPDTNMLLCRFRWGEELFEWDFFLIRLFPFQAVLSCMESQIMTYRNI